MTQFQINGFICRFEPLQWTTCDFSHGKCCTRISKVLNRHVAFHQYLILHPSAVSSDSQSTGRVEFLPVDWATDTPSTAFVQQRWNSLIDAIDESCCVHIEFKTSSALIYSFVLLSVLPIRQVLMCPHHPCTAPLRRAV